MLLLLGAIALPSLAHAQVFGKNKVQYEKFTWYYIQSDHLDIYFTEDGRPIAEFTAKAAEDALASIEAEFRYKITNRIPMIIYNSANDFQQTNVVGVYLEEGIGGVTELFKNRVVVPFTGSYADFRHVLHHELIHAVINDMFYGGSLQAAIANQVTLQLPLWFNEGLAEYQSLGGWDANSDMFMRDATTSGYLPPIPYLGGYFAYRGGQSVWWYIAEKYGKQKVGEILNRIRTARSVDRGLKSAIGLDLKELSERWMKEQKVIYWPDIATRTSPEDYAKRLTDHTEMGNFYNTSPAISPAGDQIAFISDRDDYFSIYLMSTTEEKEATQVIEGQSTSDFEDLNLLTPGITWSPDGKYIAFSGKSGSQDAVNIVNVKSGEYEQLELRLEGIYTLAWDPTGDRLAFIGNSASQSDLWTYDMKTKVSTNLTGDLFTDSDPTWSHDGRYIYFVSDRQDYLSSDMVPADFDIYRHPIGTSDLYRMDVRTGTTERLTDTKLAEESNPVPSPDGKKMLYLSDANGIANFYIMDLESRESYPVSNSLTGVYQFSISQDGKKLVFASMYEAGFDLFLLRSPFEMEPVEDLEPTEFVIRRTKEAELQARRESGITQERQDSTEAESRELNEKVAIVLGEQMNKTDTAAVSGDGKRMLFGSYAQNTQEQKKTLAEPENNVDDDGNYIVKKYKLSFSPDLVYGNAGYSTFYGVLGTTTMAFSDMLGNHQILFLTNLLGDLKNSDYALAYYYLPERIDWSVQGFHSARFIYSYSSNTGTPFLFRYRQYGGGVTASYPLDRFYRVEGGLTYLVISQENLDLIGPAVQQGILLPSVGFTRDNTLAGMWAPQRGSRYNLTLYGSPGLGSNALTFATFTVDYRKYFKLAEDVTFVTRGAGGVSMGRNAQRFFIGGTDNWINRTFEDGYIPIENAEDFAFLTPALPLRGYNYNARIAKRYALANMELRFPMVKYFFGGVLPYILQSMNGALFVDVGTAFDDVETYRAFARDENGEVINHDLLAGTGVGARMVFLGFPLKFDVAWAFKGEKFESPKYYISIGAEF